MGNASVREERALHGQPESGGQSRSCASLTPYAGALVGVSAAASALVAILPSLASCSTLR
jgi:hypothetical protein